MIIYSSKKPKRITDGQVNFIIVTPKDAIEDELHSFEMNITDKLTFKECYHIHLKFINVHDWLYENYISISDELCE